VGDAAKARGKLDPVVFQGEIAGGARADVQHDLTILDETGRNAGAAIDRNHQLRGVTRVRAPFIQRADQVRLVEISATRPTSYLRRAFSVGVSALMKAGRLNRRSRYFNTGAASFGSSMP